MRDQYDTKTLELPIHDFSECEHYESDYGAIAPCDLLDDEAFEEFMSREYPNTKGSVLKKCANRKERAINLIGQFFPLKVLGQGTFTSIKGCDNRDSVLTPSRNSHSHGDTSQRGRIYTMPPIIENQERVIYSTKEGPRKTNWRRKEMTQFAVKSVKKMGGTVLSFETRIAKLQPMQVNGEFQCELVEVLENGAL